MKILGFISPDANVGKASLLLSLGWVLADAGFRVTLLDLDPTRSSRLSTGSRSTPRPTPSDRALKRRGSER